jgi:hypothetical protein
MAGLRETENGPSLEVNRRGVNPRKHISVRRFSAPPDRLGAVLFHISFRRLGLHKADAGKLKPTCPAQPRLTPLQR